MFCPNCGKEMVEGAQFCAHCGFESPVADQASAPTEEVAAPIAETPAEAVPTAPKKKSKGAVVAIIAAVLVVALAVGGFFGFRYMTDLQTYEQACALMEAGNHEEALKLFEGISVKDSADKVLQLRKALPPVHVVCCVGAVGTVLRGAAASRSAPAATPAAGPSATGCASPSPVYNEDLLSEKRRTQNARKHSACRPDKEAGRAPKNHKALCSDSNTKRSARHLGRNALCLTSELGESSRALTDI